MVIKLPIVVWQCFIGHFAETLVNVPIRKLHMQYKYRSLTIALRVTNWMNLNGSFRVGGRAS